MTFAWVRCPKCQRFEDLPRIGCRCSPMPDHFPFRDRLTGLWVDPATGEVLDLHRPAVSDPGPVQGDLLDVVSRGVAECRSALRSGSKTRHLEEA